MQEIIYQDGTKTNEEFKSLGDALEDIKKKAKKKMKKIKKVTIKITQPIKFEWKCPSCNKINLETFYFYFPGETKVQCDYCGKIFISGEVKCWLCNRAFFPGDRE